MESTYTFCRNAAWLGAFVLVMSGQWLLAGAAEKMTPAKLVERHLASIGTREARAAVRNRSVTGAATVFRLRAFDARVQAIPEDRRAGDAVFVSEGKSVRLGLHFADSETSQSPRVGFSFAYTLPFSPSLDVAFDGKTLRSGGPSNVSGQLSPFVMEHFELIKEGLMGGTLTTAWALLDVAGRRPRLEYHGLKKLDGREYHELRYLARKVGGNMPVLMYFDPQTFRHVRTECRFDNTREDSLAVGYSLTEEFAEFAVADGLTLPRTCKLILEVATTQTVERSEWAVTFEPVRHNQQLDPGVFVLPQGSERKDARTVTRRPR
jgi:hypothetical protein